MEAHDDLAIAVESMQRELEELRTELHRLRSENHDRRTSVDPAATPADVPTGTSRRQLLRRGALAVGAGVAGAGLTARPAAAADNDPVLVGNSHTGAGSTKVSSSGSSADALWGETTSSTGSSWGVRGSSASTGGVGVHGHATAASGETVGVFGNSSSTSGAGVWGLADASTGQTKGVQGTTLSADGVGVRGEAATTGGAARGVVGTTTAPAGTGVWGEATSASGATTGIRGVAKSPNGTGVVGQCDATTGDGDGVVGITASSTGSGVVGWHTGSGSDGVGVEGSGPGVGVLGNPTSEFGTGVRGFATTKNSRGVEGESTMGTGVHARSTSGFALSALSVDFIGLSLGGGKANAYLAPAGTPPTSRTEEHEAGELYFDDQNDLWLCQATGTPGTWVKLNAAPAPTINPVDPFRVYDSRFADGPLTVGSDRIVSVADSIDDTTGKQLASDAVPRGATAVLFNITITGTVGAGFLATAPGTATKAGSSSVNWATSGVTTANGTFVAIDSERKMKVFAGGAPGATTQFIIDITGFVA